MEKEKVRKETNDQTQALQDRYEILAELIRSKETEVGALQDSIKFMKLEIKAAEAYLKAVGILPRQKRVVSIKEIQENV